MHKMLKYEKKMYNTRKRQKEKFKNKHKLHLVGGVVKENLDGEAAKVDGRNVTSGLGFPDVFRIKGFFFLLTNLSFFRCR